MNLDIHLNSNIKPKANCSISLIKKVEVIPIGFQKTFKALADPVRREILVLLKKEKMSAGEIVANFQITGATISYHLSLLKEADLIFETKHKNFVFYELNTTVFEEMMLWFLQFKGGKNDKN